MLTFRRSNLLIIFVLLCSVIGCSQSKGPECYPVSGRVTYKGKPLAEATVVLHPLSGHVEGDHKPIAYTAADGAFSLTTFKTGDGAPLGEYAITIELRAPQTIGEEVVRNGPNLLPTKYARPASSGLKWVIQEGENEMPAINLL
jgi:hypothetical protein